MKEFRSEAKTVEAALEQGLEELGLRRDQVSGTVEQEPKSGFLGIGSKKAIVVIREKFRKNKMGGRFHKNKAGMRSGGRRDYRKNAHSRNDDYTHRTGRYGYEDARLPPAEEIPVRREYERKDRKFRPHRRERVYEEEPLAPEYMNLPYIEDAAEHAKETLVKLLNLMGEEDAVIQEAKIEENGALVYVSFSCKNSYEFTRDNGRMLQALQFMLNTIINKKREPHYALRLDTDGYWDSKKEEISIAVERAVACVKASGNVYRLDPMPATMRKLVHTLVQEQYPDMKTASEGEGRWRKVVIMPKPEGETEYAEPEETEEDDSFPESSDPNEGIEANDSAETAVPENEAIADAEDNPSADEQPEEQAEENEEQGSAEQADENAK